MDTKILQKLASIKEKFRGLSPEDREKISVSLLKINLGVNGDRELQLAEGFLEGLDLKLEAEQLDSFMGFLHSSSSDIPAGLLDHSQPEAPTLGDVRPDADTQKFTPEDIRQIVENSLRESNQDEKDEDEEDTVKEKIKPL